MIGDPSYALLSLGMSTAILFIAGHYVRVTRTTFRRWRDYRSVHIHVLSILGLVVALGMVISSVGVLVASEALIVGGQSMAKGALITVGMALLGTPDGREEPK